MKRAILLVTILAILSSCSSSVPSEKLMKEKILADFKQRDKKLNQDGYYTYLLNKTDGQKREVSGAQFYVAQFEIKKMAAVKLCELSENDLFGNPIIKSVDSAKAFIDWMTQYNAKFASYKKNPTVIKTINAGDSVRTSSTIFFFSKSEKGWQLVER